MDFYLSLILFSLVSALTPGPNNISLLISTSVYGIRRTIPHCSGVILGYSLMLFILGCGLSQLFIKYPYIHLVIKYIGICFICYIAWKIINSSLNQKDHETQGKPITFIEALLFQWVNPKGVVMGISVISMYINPKASTTLVYQTSIVTTVALFASTIGAATWILGGKILRKLLKNNVQIKIFNIIMAVLLVVSVTLTLF